MISRKALFAILFLLFTASAFAQAECGSNSYYPGIKAVDKNDIICMAKNANGQRTLLFTFGIWCKPCRYHLPNAMKLAKEQNLNFYVLLIEKENSDKKIQAYEYLKKMDSTMQVAILKDSTYGVSSGKKYKKFLDEITPATFENIDDMSKYIIYNQMGEVIMITNWKDNRKNDWRDDSEMIKTRILPVLQ